MKRLYKYTSFIIITIILINLFPYTTAYAQSAQTDIVIDGYFDDWNNKPYSWEYNWDNPWQIPYYWDGTQNITKEYRDENGNPYNLEIRHRMSLYSDGQFVYLHIKIATLFGEGFNGEDYQFWFDGRMAAFRITQVGGDGLTNKLKQMSPGSHMVEVRHRETGLSNTVVEGAVAYFKKTEDSMNNELELKIPLSAMVLQNPAINLETVNIIEFFTPNLMYRRIANSGVSSMPYIGVAACIAIVGGAIFLNKRKNRSKLV